MCRCYPWELKNNYFNASERYAVVLFFSVSSVITWQLSSSSNSPTLELVQFTRESARGSWWRRACAVVATRRVSARECQLRRARTHIIIQRFCARPDTTHCSSADTGLTNLIVEAAHKKVGQSYGWKNSENAGQTVPGSRGILGVIFMSIFY